MQMTRGANVQCEGFVRRTCIQGDRSNLQHISQRPHPDDGFEIIRSQSARARSGPQLVQLPRSYNMTALWLWDVPMNTLCARAGNDKLHASSRRSAAIGSSEALISVIFQCA